MTKKCRIPFLSSKYELQDISHERDECAKLKPLLHASRSRYGIRIFKRMKERRKNQM